MADTQNQAILHKRKQEASQDQRGYDGGRWNRDAGGYSSAPRPMADRVMAFKHDIVDVRTKKCDKKGKPVSPFVDKESQFVTLAVQCPNIVEMLQHHQAVVFIAKGSGSASQNQHIVEIMQDWLTADVTPAQGMQACYMLKELYKSWGKEHESLKSYAARDQPFVFQKWQSRMVKRRALQTLGKDGDSSSEDEAPLVQPAATTTAEDLDRLFDKTVPFPVAPSAQQPPPAAHVRSAPMTVDESGNPASGNPADKKKPFVRPDFTVPTNLDAQFAASGSGSAKTSSAASGSGQSEAAKAAAGA